MPVIRNITTPDLYLPLQTIFDTISILQHNIGPFLTFQSCSKPIEYFMKDNNRQKELLLILHSRFFSKQLETIGGSGSEGWFSQKEQLKAACWNGLTPELLPECFNHKDNSILLWDIIDANSFIDLEFCENMPGLEKQYALNPYVFMQVQNLS